MYFVLSYFYVHLTSVVLDEEAITQSFLSAYPGSEHLWEDLELEPRIPFWESHIFFFSKRKLTVRNDGSSKGYSIYWALNNLYIIWEKIICTWMAYFFNRTNQIKNSTVCITNHPQRSRYLIITFTHSRLIPLPIGGDFHRPYDVMKQNC